MKQLLYTLFLILGISCTCTGQEPPVYSINITNNVDLAFFNYNKEFNLYSKPRLTKSGIQYLIQGYDDINYTGVDRTLDIKVSENKQYLKMDHIIKGYVELSENDSVLHENYQCVIVSIKETKVVWSGSEDCDGEWNNNQWISNDKVIFDGFE